MSQVTIAEAAELTGKSRETINLATRDQRLSFSRNGRNRKVVDVSELSRVFELVKTLEQLRHEQSVAKTAEPAADDTGPASVDTIGLQEKLRHSEEMRKAAADERERERRQLTDEIDNLRESLERTQQSLKKSQEEHSKTMLLLTDQTQQKKSRDGEWEASLKAVEDRVANQTTSQIKALKSTHEKEVNKLKRALYAERKKTLWQKLFG